MVTRKAAAVKPERTRTNIRLTDDRARKTTKTIWDSEVKGFHVRVTPAGGRFFRVRFQVQGTVGKKVCATLGPVENWTVDDPVDENGKKILGPDGNPMGARSWAERKRCAFKSEKKVHPGKEAKATKAAPDLNAWVEVWRVSAKGLLKLKPRTQKSYECLITKHILPALGDRKLRSISKEDVFDLHEAVAEDGHTTNANRAVAVLSNLMKFAVQASKISVNPCPGLTKFDETERERTFDAKECAALETALVALETAFVAKEAARALKAKTGVKQAKVDTLDPSAADLIRFIAFSGLRRDEALELKFSDVDKERNSMSFGAHKTKKKMGTKVLPLNSHLLAIIERRKAALVAALGEVVNLDPFFVFPGENGDAPIGGLPKMWARVMRTANLVNKTDPKETPIPHDLRRTFASVCVDLGYPPAIADMLLGHSLGKIRDTYIRLGPDGILGQASQDTADWIAAAMAGQKPKNGVKVNQKAQGGTA